MAKILLADSRVDPFNNDVDENDAIGGLCDIIRDGLKDSSYNYIADIKVKNE